MDGITKLLVEEIIERGGEGKKLRHKTCEPHIGQRSTAMSLSIVLGIPATATFSPRL